MSGNIRAFSNSQNKMKSASDFIDKKRSETNYRNLSSREQKQNINCNLSNSSTGTGSYSLLFDLTKGKYYNAGKYDISHNNYRNITLYNYSGQTPETKIIDCSSSNFNLVTNKSSLTAPISQTWDINEGPFLIDICGGNPHSVFCDGNLETALAKNSNINITSDILNNDLLHSLARWNNENPLRQFKFPQTNFCKN